MRCWWSRTSRPRAERGAQQIYGEIAGYAATHDAYHHEDPAAGQPPARARDAPCAGRRAASRPDEVEPGHRRRRRHARPRRAGGRGDPHGVRRPCRGAGHRAAGLHRPAVLRRRARSTWRPRCWRCATASLPAVGNLDQPVPWYGLDFVRHPRELDVGRGAGQRPRPRRVQQLHGAQAISRGGTVTENNDKPVRTILRMRVREGCEAAVRERLARSGGGDQPGARQPAPGAEPRHRRARDFVITSEWTDQAALDLFGRSAARDRLTAALRDLRESADRSTLEVLHVVDAQAPRIRVVVDGDRPRGQGGGLRTRLPQGGRADARHTRAHPRGAAARGRHHDLPPVRRVGKRSRLQRLGRRSGAHGTDRAAASVPAGKLRTHHLRNRRPPGGPAAGGGGGGRP